MLQERRLPAYKYDRFRIFVDRNDLLLYIQNSPQYKSRGKGIPILLASSLLVYLHSAPSRYSTEDLFSCALHKLRMRTSLIWSLTAPQLLSKLPKIAYERINLIFMLAVETEVGID